MPVPSLSTSFSKFRTAQPDGTPLSRIRGYCGKLVKNKHAERIILSLIIFNSIFMGIATFDFIQDNHGLRVAFDVIDRAILVIFTLESFLRLIYHGIDLFIDLWMVFDLTVVVLSWMFESLQVARAFRAFRALRVMRLATHFEALRSMVEAVINIIPDVFAIVVLTLLLTYIFSVSFTELFKHLELSEEYFTRLDKSAFTLLQIMTLEFSQPMREVMVHYPAAWIPFVLFIIVTSIIFNNLIIGCFYIIVSSETGKIKNEYTREINESKKHCDRITTMVHKLELLESLHEDTQRVLNTLINKIGHDSTSRRLSIPFFHTTGTEHESIETILCFQPNPVLRIEGKDDTESRSVGGDAEFHSAQAFDKHFLSSVHITKMVRGSISKSLLKAQPNEEVSSKFRSFCGKLVNSEIFSKFILLCITINSIMMGVATFDFVHDDPNNLRNFRISDQIFLTIFTLEFALQFIHLRFDCFADPWLFYDFIIIILSWPMIFVQVLRSIRILRTLRLFRYFEGMRSIFEALFFILPRMSAIVILTLLLVYIFAVLFTELFKNLELSDTYFTRLDKSAFTLFQIMTLEGTGDIMREISNYYPYSGWIPFISYALLAGFINYNLIVATLCHSLSLLHDKKNFRRYLTEAQYLCENLERLDEMESHVTVLTKSHSETLEMMNSLCDSISNL